MTERTSLPYGDEEYITETARRIVTNDLLIADLNNSAWQISLAMMMTRIHEYANVGLILVPKAPHIGLMWINNTAPGCVLSCQMVAEQDIPALQAELDRMNTVLYPRQQGDTMIGDIKVNGIATDAGLIVDGDVHQDFADDRLADIAIAYGLTLSDDCDPRYWRGRIADSEEQGDGMEDNYRDELQNASDRLIELLNSKTEGGSFEWSDGSVFLVVDFPDEGDDDADEE